MTELFTLRTLVPQWHLQDGQISKSQAELCIVGNSDENWRALQYVRLWSEFISGIDIATGHLEIGTLPAHGCLRHPTSLRADILAREAKGRLVWAMRM